MEATGVNRTSAWDKTPKMELDRTYNEEEQRGALSYSIGVEARGEEETRSTKNNMEENGWRWKTSSWVAIMDDCQSFSSKPRWMERECQSLIYLMARRDVEIDRKLPDVYLTDLLQIFQSGPILSCDQLTWRGRYANYAQLLSLFDFLS